MSTTVSQIDENKTHLTWKLSAPNSQVANKFRQIIMDEVPTAAIDSIEIYSNTTAIPDEYLAHRLSLIPLIYNGTDMAASSLEIDVHATKTIRPVTTKDFNRAGGVSPVIDKMLICKLLPGESLHFKASIKIGTGKEHAKWTPVTMISFRQTDKNSPTFDFVMETLGKVPGKSLIDFALEIINQPTLVD